jgi:hypothetical protein
MARDIILAGIPRGGTTLACVLLNTIPNTVALVEPFKIFGPMRQADPKKIVAFLKDSFSETRGSLLKSGTAPSKGMNSMLVSNLFEEATSASVPRKTTVSPQTLSFPKLSSEDFSLVVKHPNAFTVLLPILRSYFECFSIVRNPLAVALSWASTQADWRNGHVPVAERLDRELLEGLQQRESVTERQIFIMVHYFRLTKKALSPQCVVRYEDIITSGGKALRTIIKEAGGLHAPLVSSNANKAYDRSKVRLYADRLLAHADDWAPFYSPEDISNLALSLDEPRTA